MNYPPVIPYHQYNSAYPTINYQQPPSAANGYGWHGNGYGWQLDPSAWNTPSLYPSLDDPVVEEPQIQSQKVEEVNAWVSCKCFILMIRKGNFDSVRSVQQWFYNLIWTDSCINCSYYVMKRF
ncbi:hypothetical protein BDFB_010924 [Asbolus verrucosus]|uniref:Uncharacterized protein n=1 Tax=Asbolus verrucosus TaxID=1661398 RepID=A0A482VD51_ASBVE|nr:hypothetical protein BDFB_010924 [Asbolus verrucosus]